jgi:hypothetical protein
MVRLVSRLLVMLSLVFWLSGFLFLTTATIELKPAPAEVERFMREAEQVLLSNGFQRSALSAGDGETTVDRLEDRKFIQSGFVLKDPAGKDAAISASVLFHKKDGRMKVTVSQALRSELSDRAKTVVRKLIEQYQDGFGRERVIVPEGF